MPISRDGKFALDDVYLRERLRQVINENGLTAVVETGLNEGRSTVYFSYMAPRVYGIDIDPVCIEEARRQLDFNNRENVTLLQGHSPDALGFLLQSLPAEKTLFFLDAHWGEPWPLPDEIRAIPKGKGILVFHDIKVPGKDFGFDGVMYQGKVCEFTYELIKDILTEWSPTHQVEYMRVASGSYRGAAIIYPTQERNSPHD